jgi:diguanylate cyclase (GGDEF)-like protein
VLESNHQTRAVVSVGTCDRTFVDIQTVLRGEGCDISRVPSIQDACDLLGRQPLDALVLDFQSSSADGNFDLVQLMGLFLCVPTVVLLSNFAPATAVELVKFGAQEVLDRDHIDEGRLAASIECAISRAQTAHYDNLTGLPNRSLLFDRLNHAINQARRYDHELAVLFIDLDRFKFINDTMGHEVGDDLLRAVAGRIRECLRDSDTVARLGGDEFIAIVTNLEDSMAAARVADKVVEALSQPVVINEHTVAVSPSVGIALFPSDGDKGGDLIKLADVAMYQAKQTGGSSYQFYRPDLNTDALRRIGLGVALQRAIRSNELELHYQPQLDVTTGGIIGVEALVRWRHPEKGLIPPDQFIPLAEELGLMVPMGDWILQDACSQLKSWKDKGLNNIRMSVNLSAHQFNRESLLEHVLKWIENAGIETCDLEVELTESSVMRNPEATTSVLKGLSEAGVHIAIDDFGTGYSSLSYLKQFPLDVLKIDRSFVSDATTDENDAAIVKTIIGLARHFNLRVVAEGVETVDHLEFLQANGCRYVQGYLIGRPCPADEVPALIEDIRSRYSTPVSAVALAAN